MMFKGRFFSSKKSDTSSPDGSSNSPRSLGSNSLITPCSGNSQFQDSSSKKDVKGKGSLLKSSARSRDLAKTSAAVTSSLKGVEITGAKEGKNVGSAAAAGSSSPIVASSLGLNKIKTRSGPLPQESFFGYGSSKDKGSALGASNLLKSLLIGGSSGGDGGSSSGSGKKSGGRKEGVELKKKVFGNVESDGWVDNGSNSDSMSTESAPSRDQSPQVQGGSRLQNGESSSEAGQFNTSWGDSGGPRSSDMYNPEVKTSNECENPKASESPRFQAILRVTSAPRKRFPGDIKSFSHELNSKGVIPFPSWKPKGLNNLEDVLVMMRARFDKAKEEVDSDLHIFAGDLVGILEKNAESHPDWQETIEDLLVLARSCVVTPPGEFWLQCEGIVQELDDKRQELPVGMLKQLHSRMHFIITRCTRLLQFHKETGFAEDEHAFQLRQSLQPNRVPPSMPM